MKSSNLPRTIHGDIQIQTIVVVAESNKFSFLPPQGWQVETDPVLKRIELTRIPGGSRITIDIIEASLSPRAEGRSETLLARALTRFAGATLVEEIRVSALGKVNPAFDLEWRASNGSRRKARVGFIPFDGGFLEYALSGSSENATQDCRSLNQLFLSLRTARMNGKLELPSVTPE